MQSNRFGMQRGECADGKLWLCCDIEPRWTSMSSPLLLKTRLLSLLCSRYPWLHPPVPLWNTCGRSFRALPLPAAEKTRAKLNVLRLSVFYHTKVKQKTHLMWFALGIWTDVVSTTHFQRQIKPSNGYKDLDVMKLNIQNLGEEWRTNLNVGGVELLLHHLLQDGERRLDGVF